MRLHQLDFAEALRLSRAVLDRPAATVAARGLARCTIAHLQAAQGELRSSGRAIAGRGRPTRRCGGPTCRTCSSPWSWPGAPGSRSPVTCAGIDAIVAAEFADLATPATSGSAPVTCRSCAPRPPGCAARPGRRCAPASTGVRDAHHQPGLRRPGARRTGARGGVARRHRAGHRGDGRLRPRPRARNGDPLPVAGAGPGRRAGRDRRPRRAAAHLRRAGRAAARATASPGTRCWPCTTWSGWTAPTWRSVGRPERAGGRPWRTGSTELTEVVEGALPPLLARHARAVSARSGDELLAVADSFDELDLNLFAAEATAMAVARLREARSPRAHAANVRLGALLERCDSVRTPGADRRAAGADRPGAPDRPARRRWACPAARSPTSSTSPPARWRITCSGSTPSSA